MTASLFDTEPTAVLSPCRTWRYALRRRWGIGGRPVLFVMLNPSTADEAEDDPTIRRCLDFARRWAAPALTVANVYAYRSTDPKALKRAEDPIGPENDQWLLQLAGEASTIVCAWGAHAPSERVADVLELLRDFPLYCLGRTRSGAPKHPLYVPAVTLPAPFQSARPATQGAAA